MGEKLQFNLSLGLFSSFDIDSGTKLLLKTIARQNLISNTDSVYDAGCGIGTIAVSIKKHFPKTTVTAADRDALAIQFTKDNAKLNNIFDGFYTEQGLLPGALYNPQIDNLQKYDLIISNIPAKAGNPVIKDFIFNCGLHLTSTGRVAVVIVQPLSNFIKDCFKESGAEVIYEEADKNYSVFHFIPGKNSEKHSFSKVYQRTTGKISGFYGLPEFDTISYKTKTTLEALNIYEPQGQTLLWNPGIGHIPLQCTNAEELILAGFDLLELQAAEFNLGTGKRMLHLPVFSSLIEHISTVDTIIAAPRFITSAGVENEIISTSFELLKKGGVLIVSGKSFDIAKVEKIRMGFILKKEIKYRGFKTIILEKK